MLLARAGYRVAIVDRARFPSDTLSTHNLWQAGSIQLRRWGLLEKVIATGAPASTEVHNTVDGACVTIPLPPHARGDDTHREERRRSVVSVPETEVLLREAGEVEKGLGA